MSLLPKLRARREGTTNVQSPTGVVDVALIVIALTVTTRCRRFASDSVRGWILHSSALK